jgi:hypothetical protein
VILSETAGSSGEHLLHNLAVRLLSTALSFPELVQGMGKGPAT